MNNYYTWYLQDLVHGAIIVVMVKGPIKYKFKVQSCAGLILRHVIC